MNDITALVSVQKSANLHRLSRLIAYAPSDELRQMAVEVEQYTDRLLGELEHYKSREERVTKLVLDNSVSWEELFKQLEEAKQRIAELESRTVTVKLPEVRITIAESKLRNLTYQQLDAYNAGATRAAVKLSQALAAAGIQVIEGEQKNG